MKNTIAWIKRNRKKWSLLLLKTKKDIEITSKFFLQPNKSDCCSSENSMERKPLKRVSNS